MNLVLSAREFHMLDGLRLQPRRVHGGRIRGERLTKKKGVSIEFADYREYSDGDDLRHLDWNVLARLQTPVVRTYQDEEDLAVHLLFDASPSMDFGEPTKFDRAKDLAAAIGYAALCGGDAVRARAVGLSAEGRPFRGRSSFPRLAEWLNGLRPQTGSGLAAGLRQFAASSVRPGIAILCGDGLDPGCAAAIRAVAARGHEVWLLQVLSQVEIDPDLEGDLRLIDGEGGAPREITANSAVLKEYRRNLEAHNAELVQAVLRGGGRYAMIGDSSLENTIRNVWIRKGWLA